MSEPRRTRIVATLGPATDPPEVLDALLAAGLDVARINLSHGTPEDHVARAEKLRAAAGRAGRTVAVLADLPGPKLRVRMPAARTLTPGEALAFSLTAEPVEGALTITEPEVLREVEPGQRLLLDDGRLQVRAERVDGDRLLTTVTVGGELLPNKGLNLPDTELTIAALTDRDRAALDVAARVGADWLALSFVRTAAAADELRQAARERGLTVPVLAKLERPEAVARAEEIIRAFDGCMVARGDLGVELPLEKVPMVQKRLIALARAAGRPVVTATDMLDSMRNNPRPTRAEANDVANAICDGTDALMLSGETAVGKYPVEALACMDRIARETEAAGLVYSTEAPQQDRPLAMAACDLARATGAAAIVTPTLSGRTARLIARHRPKARIVAPAPSEQVRRQMALLWGVQPVPMDPDLLPMADRLAEAVRAAFKSGAVAVGQTVVVLADHPVEGGPRIPTLRLVRVGDFGRSVEP
jgi:pyruvate kinase